MSGVMLESAMMTEEQFLEISELVKGICGINLHGGKKELVKARLAKRLRQRGFTGFDEYIAAVRGDPTGTELTAMLDCLSRTSRSSSARRRITTS